MGREAYLRRAQIKVSQNASTIANRKAREQWLQEEDKDNEFSLIARLAKIRKKNPSQMDYFMQSWSPFKPYIGGKSGTGLWIGGDIFLMEDTIPQKEIDQVIVDAVTESIMDNSQQFIKALLKDQFENPEPFYSSEGKGSRLSKVRRDIFGLFK